VNSLLFDARTFSPLQLKKLRQNKKKKARTHAQGNEGIAPKFYVFILFSGLYSIKRDRIICRGIAVFPNEMHRALKSF
jgi:hypothetical protein